MLEGKLYWITELLCRTVANVLACLSDLYFACQKFGWVNLLTIFNSSIFLFRVGGSVAQVPMH